MTNVISLTKEINSEFPYQTYHLSSEVTPLNIYDENIYDDSHLPASTMKGDPSGKAHLTNEQIRDISLLVSAVVFGVLALMFPQASVPYAIYSSLSVFSAVAGGILLTSKEKPVEIPLASEFSDIH